MVHVMTTSCLTTNENIFHVKLQQGIVNITILDEIIAEEFCLINRNLNKHTKQKKEKT